MCTVLRPLRHVITSLSFLYFEIITIIDQGAGSRGRPFPLNTWCLVFLALGKTGSHHVTSSEGNAKVDALCSRRNAAYRVHVARRHAAAFTYVEIGIFPTSEGKIVRCFAFVHHHLLFARFAGRKRELDSLLSAKTAARY